MLVVTGAAGFIGSAFLSTLNAKGRTDILIVDEHEGSPKWENVASKSYVEYFHKDKFLELAKTDKLPGKIEAIIHLGACSSTTEKNLEFLLENNFRYSVALAEYCSRHNLRYIYASSAATYGDGAAGYSDSLSGQQLKPLNLYGHSKNLFDGYMEEKKFAPLACGLKFFNVFGPNEYHKGDMRSVVLKSFEQIQRSGKVQLFKSYKPEFADGEQKRDFVYVKDCCEVMWWLLENKNVTGVYNLGTGEARSWKDLVSAVFTAMLIPPSIEYIDMPPELRDQYQYFTEAEMQKLKAAGYTKPFTSLEDAVSDYVRGYLQGSNRTL